MDGYANIHGIVVKFPLIVKGALLRHYTALSLTHSQAKFDGGLFRISVKKLGWLAIFSVEN
jgi:hypothetical protein